MRGPVQSTGASPPVPTGPDFIYNDSSTAAMTANVATMQAAITAIQAAAGSYYMKGILEIDSADRIYFNAGFTIDVAKFGGIRGNNTQLDFSHAANSITMFALSSSLLNTGNQHEFEQKLVVFQGLSIKGSGRENGQIAFHMLNADIGFRDLFFYTLGIAFDYGNNTWLTKAWNCHSISVGIFANVINSSNVGESCLFEGCTTGGCHKVIYCTEPTATITWIGGSFDQFDTHAVQAQTGRINIFGANVESGDSSVWFQLDAGQHGTLNLFGCTLGGQGGISSLIDMEVTWTVANYGSYGSGMQCSSGALISGNGAVNYKQYDWNSFAIDSRNSKWTLDTDANIYGDYNFGLTTVNESAPASTSFSDLWTLVDDDQAITSRTDGHNIDLFCTNDTAPSGQTNCLQATFNFGAGGTKSFGLFTTNIQPGAQYTLRFQCARDAITSGTIFVSFRWAQFMALDSNSVPRWSGKTLVDIDVSSEVVTPTTSFATFIYPGLTAPLMVAPLWATAAALVFQCNGMAAGKVYVGDISLQKWSN